MLGAAPDISAVIPSFRINAELGRQPSAGIDVARDIKARGKLGDVVIVHLGNNGPFSESEFETLMTFLADRKLVIVVNVSVPRPWESAVNQMLAANIGRFPNAVLIDWHASSDGHPEYFWDDHVHLRPDGAGEYAALIAGLIAKPAPVAAGSITSD